MKANSLKTYNGKEAVKYLASRPIDAEIHRCDNTDKAWSYKSKGDQNWEFAFNPKTSTKLRVWTDLASKWFEPRNDIDGPVFQHEDVEVVKTKLSSYSTALDRVFSGGIHAPKVELLINSEDGLRYFTRWLRLIEVINRRI